jgi:hypothetical protein
MYCTQTNCVNEAKQNKKEEEKNVTTVDCVVQVFETNPVCTYSRLSVMLYYVEIVP